MARCISWCLLSLLTILQWMSLAEASHFRAGHITWKPDSNNTLRFVFRLAFRRSYSGSYYCDEDTKSQGSLIGYGDSWNAQCDNPYNQLCSNAIHIADTGFHCTDFSVNEDWSMGENNFTVSYSSIASNHVWTVSYSSCCWISSLARYADSSWLVSTKLDLTPRSDNGKINSSPVSRSPAIFRLHEGCKQSLRIPVEDPDGDVVKCRWASKIESNIPSDSFPHGVLDEENCVLSYGGRSGTAGTYAVTLTLEDFPAGTTDFQNARPFSNVGLQFLVIISGQSGSCDDKPVFTDSTPQDGECSEVQIGSVYKAVIEVQLADFGKYIAEITTSSPIGMQITPLNYAGGIFYRNVTWNPMQSQVGQQLFCFQALDSSGSQSGWRCVTILVGLSNTPQVILGTQWPINPISETGRGSIWWRIQFDRVIKKPRTSAYIRLVLQPYGHTIYKVDTLSQYVNIDNNNRTVLHFATPKAALSMNGSYAILIDNGAVVGQGCSYDGPPTPGIKSPGDWGFPVDGICPVGFSLAPPEFTNCVDINECGGHSRSKRSYYWWWQSYIAPSSSSLAYGGAAASASVPSYLSECSHHSYLDDSVRRMSYYNGYYGYYQCDRNLASGWYRFRGAAGTQMPTTCVPHNHCSSHAPGWLNHTHPSVADGIVNATVCFNWNDGCCHWSTSIRVRNCSGFYVYELRPPPTCWLRYCGNGGAANASSSVAIPTPVATPTPESCFYNLTDPSGNFTSPYYPQHYSHDLDCTWIISVTPGYYIYLHFEHFHLEDGGSHCPYDYVQIFDGYSSSSSLILKRCAYQDAWCVYSNSSVLHVRFITDGSASHPGFSAYYERVHERNSSCTVDIYTTPAATTVATPTPNSCFYNLTNLKGHFASPRYPYYYPHNQDCTWIITVTPGYYVYLHFEHFHLEGSHSNCPYDYVQIYDEHYSWHPIIRKRCGYQDSWCVYSNTAVLYVRFITDGSVSYSGFTAYYEQVHERYSNCSASISASPSASASVSASASPPYNSECSHHSYLEDSRRGMGFYNGYYQCDNNLASGWYRFRGAAGTQMPTSCVAKYRCGTHAPGWLNGSHPSVADGIVHATVCFSWSWRGCCSWSRSIRVRNCGGFYVYELGPPPGCSMRYCGNGGANYSTNTTSISPTPASTSPTASASIAPGPASACEGGDHLRGSYGFVSSPNFPNNFPANSNCTWNITVPSGLIIKVTFISFRLEPFQNVDCSGGAQGARVIITNVASNDGATEFKLCGQSLPDPVYSLGNSIQMTLLSADDQYPGFNASYMAINKATHCRDALGMENNTITDGNISSSSQLSSRYSAIYGRLHNQGRGWLSATSDANQWLQIDLFSEYTKVTGVATQGMHGSSIWVTQYKLQYSNDGVSFQYYREQGQSADKVFAGNTNRDTVVYHDLNPPIRKRYIRFRPVAWRNWISMRVELYGCQVSECFNHSYLEDAERSMDFYNGNYQCDSNLPSGWYRFRGAAGTQMPTSCVARLRCGTHAPGWLNGTHPSVDDGVVNAKVCFHWYSGCCSWERSIRVRNCSGFYVYELGPTPGCHFRYCGNGGANYATTSTNIISPTSAQSLPAATPIPGNNFDHLNQPYGNFTSPNYPGCYPISTYWTWLIEAPIGQYIRLHFKSFHLEGKASCPWDYVEIFDGNSLSSSRMIKACGQMAPWELFSSGRFLFVRFYSDAIVRRPGFFATYQRVSYRHSVALPTQVSSTSAVQCHAIHTATATATAVNGIHPTPSSGMHSSFYAASSVNVLPDPSQFELHLPSDCDQICSNTIGSYTCSCISGYQLAPDGKSCSDIDECSSNNGGCSHHCFNIPGSFYCDCPEGITMGANNLTCVEPGVSVDCGDSRMTVSLEKKTFPFFDVAQLHLRYASCKATENDTHLLISTDLNGCGTLVNETQDALIFWNEIRADAVIIDFVITRTHDIRLPFYCSYSRNKLISLSFTPRRIHFGQEVGYGNFTFSMEFYKSSSYATPYALQDYPLEVQLDDYLYVQYSVESSADLVIMAENCKATKGSSHSWPQYNIIQNGCPRDTTLDYNYDPSRAFQQFRIKTFRFFNEYDTVYFHCELLACHRYSPNSRCEKSCLNGNKRKKREVTRDEVEHDESTTKITLTQGPVVIKETGQSGDTDQSKQTALIGGVAGASAFGLIAAIALAVLFVKYRIARRLMNRNKVGDLYTTQDEQMSRRNAYIQEDDMIENEDAL